MKKKKQVGNLFTDVVYVPCEPVIASEYMFTKYEK